MSTVWWVAACALCWIWGSLGGVIGVWTGLIPMPPKAEPEPQQPVPAPAAIENCEECGHPWEIHLFGLRCCWRGCDCGVDAVREIAKQNRKLDQ